MALENLENVFQDVSPQNSDIEKNVATKKPVEIEPEFDSVFDDLIKLKRIDIKDPDSPQTKQPSIEITDEGTKKRQEELFQNIGQNNKLGLNDLILEKLYNVNHTAVELGDREPIDIGKFDENGNPVLINTLRSGMGDLTKLDIKGYSEGFRVGGGNTPEPYIVQPIGSDRYSTLSNRDFLPLNRALDDTSRLLTFYGSGAGLAFIAKENITNTLIGKFDIFNPLASLMAPPIANPIQGNTSFLNFTNDAIQDLGNTIGSLRRPLVIEYSKRAQSKIPFGVLGDSTFGVDVVKKIEVPTDQPNIIQRGLRKLKDAAIEKLGTAAQKPQLERPSSFFDLSGGPGNHTELFRGYRDEFSRIDPVEQELQEPFEDGNVKQGDFYVRFKDLRQGGKVIYFRGYVTGITENVNPSFTSTNYIGRSEPVYLYERGDRDVSFNLRVYPANETEFVSMYEKIEYLTSLAYPKYLGRVIATDSEGNPVMFEEENVRMQAPFTELYMGHIGSRRQGQFGFIKSLSYTVNETGDWDALTALPRLFDIAISYQILHKKPPSMKTKFYGSSVGYGNNE